MMALSFSIPIWRRIERLELEERKRLLKWQLQAREPIHSFKDIRIGDHLVKKDSFLGLIPYEHHFLCTGFNCDGKPKIIHYYNTAWRAIIQSVPSILGIGAGVEQLGIVQEMCIEDYISEAELQAEANEVARVVWPDELRRFSVEEVVNRANKRKGENWYDLAKNNCETFVLWCLCDLQISLQVSTAVRYLREFICGGYNSLKQVLQQVPKVLIEQVGDNIFPALMRLMRAKPVTVVLTERIGVYVGAALSIFAEVYVACNEVHSAIQKWKKGIVINTRKGFIKTVIDSVLSAPIRAGGSIGGMLVGSFLIPVPVLGGIIGAVLGSLAGHHSSNLLTEFGFTEFLADCIDYLLPPDKRADKLD